MLAASASVTIGQSACSHDDVRREAESNADAGAALTTLEGWSGQQSVFGADVSVALAGPQSAALGEVIELTLMVTNHGPKEPTQYFANIELTPNLTFRTSSKNCQEYRPPGGLSCTIPGVQVGATFEATIGAVVADRPASGVLTVDADVTISPKTVQDLEPGNNATQLRINIAP